MAQIKKKQRPCKKCGKPSYTPTCTYCSNGEKMEKVRAKPVVKKPIAKKPVKPKVKKPTVPKELIKKPRKKRRAKTPYTKAKEALWRIFSIYIRLRDSDDSGFCKCCTCEYVGYYKKSEHIENSGKMQAGHFVPKKRGNSVYFLEENVHAQCDSCNLMQDGNLIPYTLFIEAKYGAGKSQEICDVAKTLKKFKAFEFEEMTDYYTKEVERLKNEKRIRD